MNCSLTSRAWRGYGRPACDAHLIPGRLFPRSLFPRSLFPRSPRSLLPPLNKRLRGFDSMNILSVTIWHSRSHHPIPCDSNKQQTCPSRLPPLVIMTTTGGARDAALSTTRPFSVTEQPGQRISSAEKWDHSVENAIRKTSVGFGLGLLPSALFARSAASRLGVLLFCTGIGAGIAYGEARYLFDHDVAFTERHLFFPNRLTTLTADAASLKK